MSLLLRVLFPVRFFLSTSRSGKMSQPNYHKVPRRQGGVFSFGHFRRRTNWQKNVKIGKKISKSRWEISFLLSVSLAIRFFLPMSPIVKMSKIEMDVAMGISVENPWINRQKNIQIDRKISGWIGHNVSPAKGIVSSSIFFVYVSFRQNVSAELPQGTP